MRCAINDLDRYKFINTKPPELRFRALLTEGAAELKLAKPGA